MLETIQPEFILIFVLLLFSAAAFFLRILSPAGILLANFIGIISFVAGGFAPFTALLVFYAVAEFATWLAGKSQKKHEKRSVANIFGNCSVAIAALILGQTTAFFGAISAAFADTISSEIGLLSKGKPVMITTLKSVEKGTDGAVSALGLVSALVGAAIMGAVYYAMVAPSTIIVAAIIIVGFLGSVFDSVLGATLQRKGLIDNNHVNFITTIFGALLTVVLVAVL